MIKCHFPPLTTTINHFQWKWKAHWYFTAILLTRWDLQKWLNNKFLSSLLLLTSGQNTRVYAFSRYAGHAVVLFSIFPHHRLVIISWRGHLWCVNVRVKLCAQTVMPGSPLSPFAPSRPISPCHVREWSMSEETSLNHNKDDLISTTQRVQTCMCAHWPVLLCLLGFLGYHGGQPKPGPEDLVHPEKHSVLYKPAFTTAPTRRCRSTEAHTREQECWGSKCLIIGEAISILIGGRLLVWFPAMPWPVKEEAVNYSNGSQKWADSAFLRVSLPSLVGVTGEFGEWKFGHG